jgi:hypothetical protein
VGFDEARNDNRILKAPVDLETLVGDPAAHFIERACTQDLAVHDRYGLRGWCARIERHDRLRL